jgi:E-phenylitaconyl-CoA hydratase
MKSYWTDRKNFEPQRHRRGRIFTRAGDMATSEGVYTSVRVTLRIFKPMVANINGYCFRGSRGLAVQLIRKIAATS